MDKKYALISVYNKKNLRKICKSLLSNNVNIISTGATAKHISALGFPCKLVRNFTKSNEILDEGWDVLERALRKLTDEPDFESNFWKNLSDSEVIFPQIDIA